MVIIKKQKPKGRMYEVEVGKYAFHYMVIIRNNAEWKKVEAHLKASILSLRLFLINLCIYIGDDTKRKRQLLYIYTLK